MKLVYAPEYEVDVGDHVFRTSKYRLVKERLIERGIFKETDFVRPDPASDSDILLVHTQEYVTKLKRGTLTPEEKQKLEIRFSPELVAASWLCAGGSILAARLALKEGACYHDGGGFHHAFRGHGEGFCVINDHCVAVRRLLSDKAVKKVLIVDCDVHQANGTASIFYKEPAVFTFSIHEEDTYPFVKPPSDIDVGLRSGAADDEYLTQLNAGMERAWSKAKPDLVVYVAGADTYAFDQLGGLSLTITGMKERDEMVFGKSRQTGIPVVSVLAGGYAADVADLITIHANTALVMQEMLGG